MFAIVKYSPQLAKYILKIKLVNQCSEKKNDKSNKQNKQITQGILSNYMGAS